MAGLENASRGPVQWDKNGFSLLREGRFDLILNLRSVVFFLYTIVILQLDRPLATDRRSESVPARCARYMFGFRPARVLLRSDRVTHR